MNDQVLIHLERLEKKIDTINASLNDRQQLPKKWLRTNEVCEYLSISTSQLQVYKNEGFFSARKLGGTNYYNRQEVDLVIEGLIDKY